MQFTTRFLSIISLVIILLSACTKEEAPKPVEEKLLSLEEVVEMIESETPRLIPYGIQGSGWSFNGVEPNVYSFDVESTKKTEHAEFIYIYIYESEAEQQEGTQAIKDEIIQWDIDKMIQYPFVYNNKNVVVIYLSDSKETPMFKDKIQKAIKEMG